MNFYLILFYNKKIFQNTYFKSHQIKNNVKIFKYFKDDEINLLLTKLLQNVCKSIFILFFMGIITKKNKTIRSIASLM